MTVHRILATATAVAAAPLLSLAVAAGPAHAHGATGDPMSRAMACGPEGGARAGTAACRAARAVGGADLRAWDNLRVAGVAGRDRRVIPDGRLCSGGLDAYRGLDLARADWPATRLPAGAAYTFTYRGTIGHRGTFRMYVTRAGYDPARPLRWADLEAEPFLTAVDPVLRDGAYRIEGRLPARRTGRHLVYTVWQTSNTPDTYYSCSDVDFTAGPAAAAPPAATRQTPPAAAPAASPSVASPSDAAAASPSRSTPAQPSTPEGTTPGLGPAELTAVTSRDLGRAPYVAVGIAVLTAVAAGIVHLRRRGRQPEPSTPGPIQR
jgi:chitin-binding protein